MSILARYIAKEWLRTFAFAMIGGITLFLVIDFFARIGRFMRHDPELILVGAYFLAKLPRIVSEIFPAATLIAVLVSLGNMAKNREILALRACGISTWKLAAPLVLLATLASAGMLVWTETVVPPSAARAHYIDDVLIKRKDYRGFFNATSLWFQSRRGFVHIDYFDAGQNAIYGLSLYEADDAFRVQRLVEIPTLKWRDGQWEEAQGVVKDIGPNADISVRPLEPGEFVMDEAPNGLQNRSRKAREFSFRQLRDEITLLQEKGHSADSFVVDLHHKLAWPFAGVITVLIGFPIAITGGRRAGITYNMAVGLFVGFAYWVLTAFALSAGKTGALPAPLAAWTANITYFLLAGLLYLRSDAS